MGGWRAYGSPGAGGGSPVPAGRGPARRSLPARGLRAPRAPAAGREGGREGGTGAGPAAPRRPPAGGGAGSGARPGGDAVPLRSFVGGFNTPLTPRPAGQEPPRGPSPAVGGGDGSGGSPPAGPGGGEPRAGAWDRRCSPLKLCLPPRPFLTPLPRCYFLFAVIFFDTYFCCLISGGRVVAAPRGG